MATLRKLVSDVRSMHKMLSTDNLITDRVVALENFGLHQQFSPPFLV